MIASAKSEFDHWNSDLQVRSQHAERLTVDVVDDGGEKQQPADVPPQVAPPGMCGRAVGHVDRKVVDPGQACKQKGVGGRASRRACLPSVGLSAPELLNIRRSRRWSEVCVGPADSTDSASAATPRSCSAQAYRRERILTYCRRANTRSSSTNNCSAADSHHKHPVVLAEDLVVDVNGNDGVGAQLRSALLHLRHRDFARFVEPAFVCRGPTPDDVSDNREHVAEYVRADDGFPRSRHRGNG